MFEEALPPKSKIPLALLGKSGLLKGTYLAGGTALALQIGHRVSIDFDFFTNKKFNGQLLLQKLVVLPVNFKLERSEEGTILGYVDETRFSLFFYSYPLLGELQSFSNINLASIKDIAPMKIAAISDRGTRRDFIDLYFILAVEKIYSLEEVLDFYDDKFSLLYQNKLHILKALTYFEDAENEHMPKMIKNVKWAEIKTFFEKEVKRLVKSKL